MSWTVNSHVSLPGPQTHAWAIPVHPRLVPRPPARPPNPHLGHTSLPTPGATSPTPPPKPRLGHTSPPKPDVRSPCPAPNPPPGPHQSTHAWRRVPLPALLQQIPGMWFYPWEARAPLHVRSECGHNSTITLKSNNPFYHQMSTQCSNCSQTSVFLKQSVQLIFKNQYSSLCKIRETEPFPIFTYSEFYFPFLL